jgi:hypothetical protein
VQSNPPAAGGEVERQHPADAARGAGNEHGLGLGCRHGPGSILLPRQPESPPALDEASYTAQAVTA